MSHQEPPQESSVVDLLSDAIRNSSLQRELDALQLNAEELYKRLLSVIEEEPWGGAVSSHQERFVPTLGFRIARILKSMLAEAGSSTECRVIDRLLPLFQAVYEQKTAIYDDPYDDLYVQDGVDSDGLIDDIYASWDRVSGVDVFAEAVLSTKEARYWVDEKLILTGDQFATLAIALELDQLTGGKMFICIEKLGSALKAKSKEAAKARGKRALDALVARKLISLGPADKSKRFCRRCDFLAHARFKRIS